MAGLAGCLVLSIGLAVVTPQLLGRFVDRTQSGAGTSALAGLAGWYLLAAVAAGLLWIASEYLGAAVAWRATNAMRADLLEHCLGLDSGFYQEHAAGELIERIDGDVGVLSGYFSDMFLLALSNVLLLVGVGAALFAEDWRLGLCYVPFVAGSVFLLRRLVGVALPAATEQRRRNAILLGFLEERLGGVEDIRGNGSVVNTFSGFWLQASGLMTAARRAAQLGVRWPAAAQGLASASIVLALGAGSLLYFDGAITLGSAYAVIAYGGMLQAPLMVIVMQFRQMEESAGALRRINQLFHERSAVPDGPGRFERPATAGAAVEARGVSFCYRPGEYALRDVSFSLAPGERLALVGRTGSGKSTLMRLLFRLADPTEGQVLVAGQDPRTVSMESLRDHVAMVSQDVHVFHASVRDNIALFDAAVPDSRLTEAMAQVGLGDWLDRLAEGLDTVLGAGAAGLSAGEAQLLAFARILIADPALVLLDEASSRLDPAGRRAFDAALDRMLAGRTAVVIAHQMQSVRTVDRVLVLGDGRVVEHGPRRALMADPDSVFSALSRSGEVFA
jgi:ABC-type multidrug transport system fused ATPase/permease subunit